MISDDEYESICNRVHVDAYNYLGERLYTIGELLIEMGNCISELEEQVEQK